MDKKRDEELTLTNLWVQWERGVNFNRRRGMYSDTDRNYRMYNGNQWEGLESGGMEKVSHNIIKPVVKHKVGVINSNLWAINYSADNIDEFREQAKKVCELLNKKASQLFEKDYMDFKIRKVSKQACINTEGVIYVNYNEDIENEVISKTDVCYGNENSSEIQTQPYIIIKARKPVSEIKEIARREGATDEELELIVGDKEFNEEAGKDAKEEVNDMCNLITYMRKVNGTIWFKKATKYVDIIKEERDSGLSLYPLEHFVWEELEGSARGEGEVKPLIPNQIELNKTLMRRALSVKLNAYTKNIANRSKIINPEAIDKVGVTILTNDMSTDDVSKIFKTIQPASMSPDAEKLQNELNNTTRELAGAGDITTGAVNPEQASGRAILAVKSASEVPLTEQVVGIKRMSEGLARIYLDMWKVYGEDLIIIVEEDGQDVRYTVPKTLLEKIKATIKIDVTPMTPFDKYAREMSWENLFIQGKITFEEFVEGLDFDSTLSKTKLQEVVENRKKAKEQIAQIEAQALQMENETNQILNADANMEQMNNQMMLQGQA